MMKITKVRNFNCIRTIILIFRLLDFLLNVKLRYVRIYFDATTFDKIYKDSAAKGVDMLSAIGGTMGLFTGFSIISGIEILYFAVKMILNTKGMKIK